MRAAELPGRNKFGVSQLYKHEVKVDGLMSSSGVIPHPLVQPLSERESVLNWP